MNYVLYFLVAFALSLVLTPIVRIYALKNRMIAYPRADRWHKNPTALSGGIAIYLAAIIPIISLGVTGKNIFGLVLGATFLFIVGLIDDRVKLAPYAKLFAQIIAGCLVVFSGVTIGLPVSFLIGVPLTLLWIVGVTNAFNLLDNIDGLAAGIAAISSLMLFFSFLLFSNNTLGIVALILTGAALGFLPYNFNPAKIFMGDSGSMFLGYCLAVISLSGTPRHISNLIITMLIPVLILSVPIFDTIFVMILRLMQKRGLFEGGKDHTSHHLVTLGISQKKTVILLYSISLSFGLIGILFLKFNFFIISVLSFLAIVILLFFGLFLFEGTSYRAKLKLSGWPSTEKKERTILTSVFLYKRRIIELVLDFVFICIAYYSAYFLRFEGAILQFNLDLLRESLVWIILIKMSVFFLFGFYRGVWRYIGISDFFTIFKVISLGSIFSVLFFTFFFRFQNYSRAVFFIDWLVLLFLILGSRFMFRIVGEFLSRMQSGGKKVLIFGAGDIGEMVIREIKRNATLNYTPVGFVDDDPHKTGTKIHGIPVLGSRDKLKELINSYMISEIIIAVSKISPEDISFVAGACRECGITYKKVKGILDD
ncbi:MAG: hypothetical protein KKE64_01260 [Candidatus Omnitrophica bacterium]|nr:hypothetical protein [Candidatus Omnitrophota bacterium]